MKSINLVLLATAALASLAITMTVQQQNVAAFNDQNQLVGNVHNHETCNANGCTSNSGAELNTGDVHNNVNCNSQRAGDECSVHTHTKP